jgi:16S rRNA (uracil1498-N3)-methyltransferase
VIRLFVPFALNAGLVVQVSPEQAHYLTNVMRVRTGDDILLFNGADGEWDARIVSVGRRATTLEIVRLTRPQSTSPDLDLLVALVKRARLETIVEKAAELGARRVRPLITARTNSDHANVERLAAIAIEASEQTGRLDTPEVAEPVKLGDLLAAWRGDRRLMFCDEAGDAPPVLDALKGTGDGPWAILIGPEGGFSPEERAMTRAVAGAVPVSLGPRVLRADTAAIAALSLWQAAAGDWRGA